MKYLLDTNMCIFAQKGNVNVLKHIQEHWCEGIAISTITLAELRYGVEASEKRERNLDSLLKFLSLIEIISFDELAAEEYGCIRAELRKAGTPIGTMDMLIAAHAKAENLIVVTNNTREFKRVSGIQLEDWKQ